MDGPGGGWPEVKLMGNVDAIKNWLKDDYVQDEEDMQNWIASIETGDSDLGEGFGDKLRSVGRFAGDMLGIGKDDLIDALFRQFDEYDIKNTKYGERVYSDYINDRSAARPNFKSFFQVVDNLTIKAIAQELGVDYDDENNLRREGEEEQGDSVTGDKGWEANTLADYFSNSEENTKDIAKQIDFLLRENYQDDVDDIVDLIIELAQDYADERINTSDLERGTFDEAKEKKGEDAEKKEKDYKGMNMSKGDVLNKMGKGKTNTVKGDRAKSYVPPHASKKDSLSESKIKPNREFLW
jgi:hypothetical protein